MNRSHADSEVLLPVLQVERPTRLELEERVASHRARLRRNLERIQHHAAALSPAHQVKTSPIAWVIGAAAFGFLLGAITAPRRH